VVLGFADGKGAAGHKTASRMHETERGSMGREETGSRRGRSSSQEKEGQADLFIVIGVVVLALVGGGAVFFIMKKNAAAAAEAADVKTAPPKRPKKRTVLMM